MIYVTIALITISISLFVITVIINRRINEMRENFIEKLSLVSLKMSEQLSNYADIIEKINEINEKIHDTSFINFEESEKQYIKGLNNLLNYHGEQQT